MLISDFKDTKANGFEAENWENKQEMMIESPALLKWNRTKQNDRL
jgi:hypothetical protein